MKRLVVVYVLSVVVIYGFLHKLGSSVRFQSRSALALAGSAGQLNEMSTIEEATKYKKGNGDYGSPPSTGGAGHGATEKWTTQNYYPAKPSKSVLSVLGKGIGDKSGKAADMMIDGLDGSGGAMGDLSEGLSAHLVLSGGKPADSSAPARARLWFPQTFLFDPLVVTDDHGHATVDVKVPDRLTTWRVLALAHSREGAQAGVVTHLLGTLPTYVDPIVPPELHVGDEVRLPFMVVNTQEAESTQPLRIQAEGATISGVPSSVRIPGGGSEVEMVSMRVNEPGALTVRATLGRADDVTRVIPVTPLGHPVEQDRAGTLAAPRDLEITLPNDADAKGARVRLLVYGGALSLLRSELDHAGARTAGPAEDAYGLLLAGEAPKLLKTLGGSVDANGLSRTTAVAIQRVVHDARSPDATVAALTAEAALAIPEDTVLKRIGARLTEQLAGQQHPDGTFGGNTTVQRMLTTTAESVRAIRAGRETSNGKSRSLGASLRAAGAFERYLSQVEDPYTASAIAASEAISGHLLDTLRQKIRDAAVADPQGSRTLTVPAGVVRADGAVPSDVELAALAVLALDPQKDSALRADLGSVLLARYRPETGWGDGRTNLAALRAVLKLFKDPLPGEIVIRLEEDGHTVASGLLDAHHPDMLALDSSISDVGGHHRWTVTATPPVAGLGYSLAVSAFEPWKTSHGEGGLALEIKPPKDPRVGVPGSIAVSVAGPARQALVVVVPLPAGVQPVKSQLDKIVEASTITGYEIHGQSVTLNVGPLAPGQTSTFDLRVVPTLGGKLHAGASNVHLADRVELTSYVPPMLWEIR